MEPICFLCEMRKYSQEKLLDNDFVEERKNEFFPEDQYGDRAYVCKDCDYVLFSFYHAEFKEFLEQKFNKEYLKD